MVEAAGGAQPAYQLLMLEHLDTLAETASKAISNIKFDKVVGWEGGGGNGQSGTAGFIQNMGKMMPPICKCCATSGVWSCLAIWAR
jgi:flotillin